jgi:hypothetical protein
MAYPDTADRIQVGDQVCADPAVAGVPCLSVSAGGR